MKNFIKTIILISIIASCKRLEVEPKPPTLDAVTISEISTASARLSSNISDSGNQDISDYGFVYSETNSSPTLSDSKTSKGAVDPKTPTPIAFTDVIQNLKPNTTYNVRAYSTIASGPVFSNVITFKTSDIVQPKIRTDAASNITTTSARLQGTLEAKGTFDISESGIVWSATNTSPTTADSKIAKTGNVTTFPSSFTFEIANLTVNANYNYRAYVISNGVTTYGNTLNFRTLAIVQAAISTDGSSNISTNSARMQGTVLSKGTFDITEYGICYSVRPTPTTADTKGSKTGNPASFPSAFTIDAMGLSDRTTYYFRAYIISNGVTTYGSVLTFQTSAIVLPTISTDGQTNNTDLSRTLSGTLLSKGSFDISEYGMCWSSTNTTPTTADSKGSKNGNPATFPEKYTINTGSIVRGQTYYFRAYVISNGVTTYGSTLNFVAGR